MKYKRLGDTTLEVSVICLGTMTWGQQNNEGEGHLQLDYALDQGINFIDTAEMYPVPGKQETQGHTERIIGTWFKKSGKRDQVILATKITGPSVRFKYLRPKIGFDRKQILSVVDQNLARLQTDYIDIYQLHWPERQTNYFGQLGYDHDDGDEWKENFLEVAETMSELILAGKIRHWGVSNETPWGMMRYLRACDSNGLAKCVTIQNPYSLLNRSFEVGLAEMAIRERIPLLAYSPLGFGLLSGKYHTKHDRPQDRLNQFKVMSRYNNESSWKATQAYIEIAKDHGLTPTQLSLAFVNSRPFLGSTIIGATDLVQLKENIESIHIDLTDEVIKSINNVHKIYSNPAP